MAEPRLLPCAVPATDQERDELLRLSREHVCRAALVPPLTLDELRQHADNVLAEAGSPASLRDYVTVLLNNAVWWSTVAEIPFDRRVLLLPQCLRDRTTCPAELDDFGLLCEECGRCTTGVLQAEAEALGYVVLVAEGTTVVTSLLEAGQVDCVIGVSCLSTLERSFPYTTAAAVPAIALPLLGDGCNRTQVDVGSVREAIGMRSDGNGQDRLDLDTVRSEVDSWFAPDRLHELLEGDGTSTEAVAVEWVATGGKRWRPFLAACVHRALARGSQGAAAAGGEEAIRRLAVAVECFHKASLAHDDIEDDDDLRYDLPTLHRRHGVAIALNAGDLLIGEGYRLISESGLPAEQQARMLRVAARSHRELCLGQGDELAWSARPGPLPAARVIEIFRRKTAPAFEVALTLGAISGGADDTVCEALGELSVALGIAYQIRDDIEDFAGAGGDLDAMRPSLLVALALEGADAPLRARLEQELSDGQWSGSTALIRRIVHDRQLESEAWQLYERYRDAALEALRPLRRRQLKSLLFRIVHKVLAPHPQATPAPTDGRRSAQPRRLPVVGRSGDVEEGPQTPHVV